MRLLLAALLTALSLNVSAQITPPKNAPELEFALQLKVTLGEAFGIDNTQHGRRTVIPITGGTFEGPLLKGTIINGGADYQLNAGDRTELEASTASRPTTASTSTSATAASLPAERMPTAIPPSTSRPPRSSRRLPTVPTAG